MTMVSGRTKTTPKYCKVYPPDSRILRGGLETSPGASLALILDSIKLHAAVS